MKTHEIARVLSLLSHALRRGPNQELEDFLSRPVRRPLPLESNIPVALSTLVALSDFDKSQWMRFIQEQSWPVEVRPRDASRDILGKILRYLEEHPEARRRLANSSGKERSETSPELMRALQLLLK